MAALQLPKYNKAIALSQVIEEMVNNPSLYATVYLRLLKEDIYVIVGAPNTREFYASNFDSNVSIMQLKNGNIPVFTDPDHIYDGGVIHKEVDYMKVKGRSFFELMLGATVEVNPFSKAQITLKPDLIASLLDTSFFTLKKNTLDNTNQDITINRTNNTPLVFLEHSIQYFDSIPSVYKAYIATILDKKIENKPHYIIALECSEIDKKELTRIINKLSKFCMEDLKNEHFIEVITLEKNHPYYSFFISNIIPFYMKPTP
ncbi:MAG: enhanced serine sensitivity protein SseB [Flavobacteriaceae bacterium]|jgi:hypothetical protein|nr:enhanced serine sensitivity protein SseB [Flavobacteriaceae bacterium]